MIWNRFQTGSKQSPHRDYVVIGSPTKEAKHTHNHFTPLMRQLGPGTLKEGRCYEQITQWPEPLTRSRKPGGITTPPAS